MHTHPLKPETEEYDWCGGQSQWDHRHVGALPVCVDQYGSPEKQSKGREMMVEWVCVWMYVCMYRQMDGQTDR